MHGLQETDTNDLYDLYDMYYYGGMLRKVLLHLQYYNFDK